MLIYLQNFLSLIRSVGWTSIWTEEKSKALLLDYHVNYLVQSSRYRLTREECERHYSELYESALSRSGRNLQESISNAIDKYYAERMRAPVSQPGGRVWLRKESLKLIEIVYKGHDASGIDRTDKERFIYYYRLLGIIFMD